MKAPPRPTAADHYELSRALLDRGDLDGALEAVQQAIVLEPEYPNAHNLAGWILLQRPARTAADLDAAIACFREACRVGPYDALPLINLGDTLVTANRSDEAFSLMERAAEGALAAPAHNWLGWHLGFQRAEVDPTRAIAHLQAATQARPWWAIPWMNLAALLERIGALAEAYVAYQIALTCSDVGDKKQVRRRVRELEAELQRRGIEPPIVLRAEDGQLLGPEFVAAERACREARFDEAITAIEALARADSGKLVDAIGIAERGAKSAHDKERHEEARRLLQLALRGYQVYASWSTSGAEGSGRMLDVERVRRLLGSWP